LLRLFCLIALTSLLMVACHQGSQVSPSSSKENYKALMTPSDEKYTEQSALGMIRAGREVLAPVYGPLAEQIVADFSLDKKTGIGVDIGSGPGTLIIELCKRTQLHWINADINPHFFPYFYRQAKKHGFGHRVSAIFADVHSLPFCCDYADVVVSRGSFGLWADKVQAFREIYRILKPGSVAYIGRGFSRNLPVETAKQIRAKQHGMKYNVEKTANELCEVMDELGIKQYRIHIPKPPCGEKVNYGVWIEFHKPESACRTSRE